MAKAKKKLSEEEIEADRKKRFDECQPQVDALFKKYQFKLGAQINWSPSGIVPNPVYIDTKFV